MAALNLIQNSKALYFKGLITICDINAAVKFLLWIQRLLPLLMQTTTDVFCLKSDLLPKPDKTNIPNVFQYTKRQLPICLFIRSACALVGEIRYLNAFNTMQINKFIQTIHFI